MSVRYEIELRRVNQVGNFWTVVRWEGEFCRGGDHNWLELWMAEEAKLAYELGIATHGESTATEVLAARGRLAQGDG